MSQKIKGGRKLVRTGKDAGYYDRQFARTSANKMRRAVKRRKNAEYWASAEGQARKHGEAKLAE